MPESRRSPRSLTKQRGTVTLSDRSDLECTVRDVNSTGARLDFRNPLFLPRTFRLRFGSVDQKVTVVWQRGLYAGVKFQTPLAGAAVPKKRRLSLFSFGR